MFGSKSNGSAGAVHQGAWAERVSPHVAPPARPAVDAPRLGEARWPVPAAPATAPTPPWGGPRHDPLGLLAHALDEIDYGMLLVDGAMRVLYCNHAARLELDGVHPLQLAEGRLRTASAADATALQDALAGAGRGLRRLATLGQDDHRVAVSVVPLPGAVDASVTLLVLGKRAVCQELSVHGYARAIGLTPAETRVLERLCAGEKPTEVAQKQGVAIATVRTQIGAIRNKTGASSIRDLVRQVAVLPPMVGTLRSVMPGAPTHFALA